MQRAGRSLAWKDHGLVDTGAERGSTRLGHEQFASDTDAPRQARWWLAGLLRQHGLDHELHDVMVMVSELATNVVKHATGTFEVGAWLDGARLRVEVADNDPNIPQVQWVPAGATSGRGLLIVETLSDAWGVNAREGGGKAVWFELRLT
jgi:anti-sigma regulatory factor (Ser/Thr protein kinase)